MLLYNLATVTGALPILLELMIWPCRVCVGVGGRGWDERGRENKVRRSVFGMREKYIDILLEKIQLCNSTAIKKSIAQVIVTWVHKH